MTKNITYKDAGVDVESADALVERIKALAAPTQIPETVSHVGGFSALCALPSGMRHPLLVSSTDGVGTKLEVAIRLASHTTVGEDLVAMCVNDILTSGARPLFFLDYLATSKLDVSQAADVIAGVASGCLKAKCALIGGETAEMPGFYPNQYYDLAGFAVGVVERDERLGEHLVQENDVLIGITSSGLHSNGYSLTRKLLWDIEAPPVDLACSVGERPLAQWLLEPTLIYTEACQAMQKGGDVHALCHVTGGGVPGNLPRVLPAHLAATINEAAWPTPAIFSYLAERGDVDPAEMHRVYNMGIGMIAVAPPDSRRSLVEAIEGVGLSAWEIGHLRRHEPQLPRVEYT